MEDFKPSRYQQRIFNFFEKGVGNAVINAKAGSGKTSTAVKALNYIPPTKRVLFVAFNKDIVEEIRSRIGDKKNITISTYHSLGKQIVDKCLKNRPTLDEFKYKSFLIENIGNLSNGEHAKLSRSDSREYTKNCLKLAELARVNCAQNEKEIENVILRYGITKISNESHVVKNLLDWGRANLGTIDYTDMIWLPYELGLSSPDKRFDWVIIDEAQDSSPVQQKLFLSCIAKGGRFCCIGDVDQTINAWCGGDKDAFNNFLHMPNVTLFDLPISYRCPKKVIEIAQTIVPTIQAAPNAILGSVNKDVSQYRAKSGDMVLCRNTAPLTKLYIYYLKKNIKSFIRGNDIGKNLIALIASTGQDIIAEDYSEVGLIPALYAMLLKQILKISKNYNITNELAIQTSEFMNLYDSVKVIEILSEGCLDVEALKERIVTIFSDEKGKDGICLSTVHKAKGLEADNVFILCPSLMPSKQAKEEWEIIAEKNLLYVAYTRAKKTLNFISEKYFPPHLAYIDKDDVVSSLKEAEEKLSSLGITGSTEYRVVKKITKATSNVSQPIKKKPSKKIGAKKFGKFL